MAQVQPIRRQAPPTRSPARQALADAIQTDLDLEAEIERTSKAEALFAAAGDVVGGIEEEITRQADPQALAEQLLAGHEPDDTAPERERLEKATADFERARRAVEIIRSKLNSLEGHRHLSKVKEAAGAVARAELKQRLVEEITHVRERFGELYASLLLLDRHAPLGIDRSCYAMPEFSDEFNPSPKVASLRRWLTALESDPDARP